MTVFKKKMSSWLIRAPSLRRNNCLAPENSSTAAKPSDSVPVILSDDQEQSGGGVDPQALDIGPKAATMHYLIDQAIRCYDDAGDLMRNSTYPRALFLIHQWYLTSKAFAELILQLNQGLPDDFQCHSSICSHQMQQCSAFQYRSRICFACRDWIRWFPMHFDANPQLCAVIESLKFQLFQNGHGESAQVLDTTSVPSYAWMRNISVRNPVCRQVSLSFDQWTPDDIANSLTHIEHKILRRIQFCEYKEYAESSDLNKTPTLQRSIAMFNSQSQWVQCMVLSKQSPRERAEIMAKFINVAKKLRRLQNFNTMMAVVGGLSHSSIARLAKTHSCLPSETKKELTDLNDLISATCNYSNYRRLLAECRGFKIPVIGVHLKDLIALHAALPDYADTGQINCKKFSQLALIFSHLILDLEKAKSMPDVSLDLVNTLKVSLYIQHSEDEIYALSVQREPKTFLPHPSGPRQADDFADWVKGVISVIDIESVRKHVAAMVEAVFKHYDNDHDGYISYAEFQTIAKNFPFFGSFGVLDADRDGLISKDEMIRYFVQANRHATANLRKSFIHNFHETTFLAPTSCAKCSRLLWGILRQGVKCKDCGIPVHRDCKNKLVAQCRRRKAPSIPLSRSSSFPRHFVPREPCAEPINGDFSENQKTRNSYRRRLPERAVSTVTPEWTPNEDELPVQPASPSIITSGATSVTPKYSFRSSRRLMIDTRKIRCYSESVDVGRSNSPSSPADFPILPSLASEEVFEEESSTSDHTAPGLEMKS